MKRLLNVLSVLAVLITGCSEPSIDVNDTKNPIFLSCDAEKVSGDKLIGKNGIEFDGADYRSTEKHRSGKYALKLNKSHAYGFGFTLKDVKAGTVINAEVWKNVDAKSGALVVCEKGNDNNYESSGHLSEIQGKWGKVRTLFIAERDLKEVNIYAYNLGETSTYFDDLKIEVYRNTKKPKISQQSKVLRIEIPKPAMDTLNGFRKTALAQGVIADDQKEYIQAFVDVNGEKAPVELRLKGDWTDHLETAKVSYRIKMGDGYAFDGLKTFSIQHPQTRSYGMEWFAHQLFEEEGILTTRYELIPVVINGKNCGVYALEEHFDKQLLESRKRREGPIMKFDESGMWAVNKNMMETGKFTGAPIIESAEISVFKKGRTKRTPTLFAQFLEGQSLMERYRQGSENVSEYMDIESMAKYLALLELTGGKHGLTWHNQRFYFNPITQKLEPIAFDCFMEYNLLLKKHDLISLKSPEDSEYILTRRILKDDRLRERYAHYLKKYSDPKYLKNMYKKLSRKIEKVEKLLSYEYPNMKIARDYFEFNRMSIRKGVNKVIETEPEVTYEGFYGVLPENFIYEDIALKANLEKYNADSSAQMSLRNYHSHALEVIGYTVKGDGIGMIPITPVRLEPYKKGTTKEVRFPVKPRRIHYRAANCGDSIFKCNPEEWPEAKIRASKWNKQYDSPKKSQVVLSGTKRINGGFIVDNAEELVIEPGTEIILGPGAYFVSYAPVMAKGTPENPIVIRGTNEQTQGFVCLSDQPSELSNVTFDNLGTMTEDNWRLTGAVTFYNADVKLDHCTFKNNHCEDALNTIRCKVKMHTCNVEGTYSDGFDADFCKGSVHYSVFKNTGNDCIDFSGSEFNITHCMIENSGDKGISGGEGSSLKVLMVSVDGANIAVAAKDESVVTVEDIDIEKADIAYAAYRKKPEYGPAKLVVKLEARNDAKSLKLIEKQSKLIHLGKEYVGTQKFDIDAMYAQFEK
ncbi:MAG: CotH kinase family protein [bacterium]|nr:CotH kinase family protein [bacterium]